MASARNLLAGRCSLCFLVCHTPDREQPRLFLRSSRGNNRNWAKRRRPRQVVRRERTSSVEIRCIVVAFCLHFPYPVPCKHWGAFCWHHSHQQRNCVLRSPPSRTVLQTIHEFLGEQMSACWTWAWRGRVVISIVPDPIPIQKTCSGSCSIACGCIACL